MYADSKTVRRAEKRSDKATRAVVNAAFALRQTSGTPAAAGFMLQKGIARTLIYQILKRVT